MRDPYRFLLLLDLRSNAAFFEPHYTAHLDETVESRRFHQQMSVLRGLFIFSFLTTESLKTLAAEIEVTRSEGSHAVISRGCCI